MHNTNDPSDAVEKAIRDALDAYTAQHPQAQVDVRRQNSVSVRVRIIDPDFAGTCRADRHDLVWKCLQELPEEILSEVTMLLLLTPEETSESFANYEFENPIPSRL